MSGRRVVLLLAAGVATVAVVTLTLYFLTRQLDDEAGPAGPSSPNALREELRLAAPRIEALLSER